jgi:ABC-type oligopeptide transport system ATPase subunit
LSSGSIVESGKTEDLRSNPQNNVTKALLTKISR